MKLSQRIGILGILLIISLFTATAVFGRVSSNLVIHHVEQAVSEDQNAYLVKLIFSALDSNQRQISGFVKEDILLTEDGQEVEVTALEPVEDSPVRVIVMMDTSANMRGSRLGIAKTAVTDFMRNLYEGDQIAIYTFNTSSEKKLSMTGDLKQAQKDFQSTSILAGYDACLFDATFNAVEEALSLPQGNRAVVVVSGGPDRSDGANVCFETTVDEIINLALKEDGRLPVYAVGIGENLDDDGLAMLAQATGGAYVSSDDDADLSNLMLGVSRRLANQYQVTYQSTAAPGTHNLVLIVGNYTAEARVTLPGLPPIINIESLTPEDLTQAGEYTITLSLEERGLPISELSFAINDTMILTTDDINRSPLVYMFDFGPYANQEANFVISALDESGTELAITSLNFNFTGQTSSEAPTGEEVRATKVPSDSVCPEGMVCLGGIRLTRLQLLLIGGGLLALVIGVFLLIFLLSKKKKSGASPEEKPVSLFEDATLDGFAVPGIQMGRLTVLASDDSLLVGKEFFITKSPTKIGRSVNNEIALATDSAVSREHAEIVERKGQIILREIMKTLNDGSKQRPTYGTRVNDQTVNGEVVLNSGDEITLGRRTKLRFQGPASASSDGSSEEVTLDQINLSGFNENDDATRDG